MLVKSGSTKETRFVRLPIESLQRGAFQPRESFDPEALSALADSIARQGIIEPLVVRPLTPERHEIVAGERRWRAAMQAGLSFVPCVVGDYSDAEAAAVALAENVQRESLNLMEEAAGYERLVREFHFQQDDIAAMVGKSRSHIANILRLLSLCGTVQDWLRERALVLGHARMLVGFPPEVQIRLGRQAITEGWSVRQLEDAVKAQKTQPVACENPPDTDVRRLESHLSEQVGAPVQIIPGSGSGGWLKMRFFDNDTLLGLLERMGLGYDEDLTTQDTPR